MKQSPPKNIVKKGSIIQSFELFRVTPLALESSSTSSLFRHTQKEMCVVELALVNAKDFKTKGFFILDSRGRFGGLLLSSLILHFIFTSIQHTFLFSYNNTSKRENLI